MTVGADKNLIRLDLRVVFYQESGFWVAHCLEMDVLGHGTDKDAALEMLGDAITTQIEDSVSHDNPANIFQLADARFFEMYFSGTDVADVACVFKRVQEATSRSRDVRVNEIKAREYPSTRVLA